MTGAAGGWTIERLLDEEDIEAVAALEAASFARPWTREMLLAELRRQDITRLYVLRTPAVRVAAFCLCWLIVDELHINTVAVDPALRRQGLASHLMQHVLADAAAAGASRATLEVRESNVAAMKLYRRLGFKVAGRRPGYYSQPEEDGLILCRDRP